MHHDAHKHKLTHTTDKHTHCICTRSYKHYTHTCKHIKTIKHTHIHAQVYIHIHTCTHRYHSCIPIHKYTHTHKHTPTQIHSFFRQCPNERFSSVKYLQKCTKSSV